MAIDSFGSRGELIVGEKSFGIFRLAALDDIAHVGQLPYSIKILLENLLRHEDGRVVTADQVLALARWPEGGDETSVAFTPERVLLQDFTGVPAVVDLAAIRDSLAELGGDPSIVQPVVPVELVIDHSVIVEKSGSPEAFEFNASLEHERNIERYRLLRWAQQAFDRFSVVPPDTGICHQVNLEYLSRVVFATEGGDAFPDTLVGTDSHTPMVNGLGVLGWGVGGIEAEAAMLGQALPMPIPDVVGVKLVGELRPAVTATDLVLVMAELLRRHGVVGKFVEFCGPGLETLRAEHRATLGNMSPEYGATCAICPIDNVTLEYLRLSGRSPEQIEVVERYAKEQGLFYYPDNDIPSFTELITLDLSSVEPSIAGPSRPQDRVPLSNAKRVFEFSLMKMLPEAFDSIDNHQQGVGPHRRFAGGSPEQASVESFPASDPPSRMTGIGSPGAPDSEFAHRPEALGDLVRIPRGVPARVASEDVTIDDGHVVIAAITSCTNTSNPEVMVGAGLMAKRAWELGLRSKPWVKTSLAPGSRVVRSYLERAGLIEPLAELGFDLVGYGCTTCIGNSGPLLDGVSDAVANGGLVVASVLSGNRNFEGRIHPEVRMNYLASPMLVVAYAIAGTMDIDILADPIGSLRDGKPVFLRDLWPDRSEIERVVADSLDRDQFVTSYDAIYQGDERWGALDSGGGDRYRWQPDSTYVQRPTFLKGLSLGVPELQDIRSARVLAVLGDSVTTDHISPAGSIPVDGPAGRFLIENGVRPGDFNSFGARRGNHEVMIRGTFANLRLRNALVPGVEGGFTRYFPTGEELTIFEAAERYRAENIPLLILAGKEYGSGSSRDWAAKGTMLLGVRAVIAESFERIHRSNLVGMGVLPLQFEPGESVSSLGLTGEESFEIVGIEELIGQRAEGFQVLADGYRLPVVARLDTSSELEHYRHGGILPFVLRDLARR